MQTDEPGIPFLPRLTNDLLRRRQRLAFPASFYFGPYLDDPLQGLLPTLSLPGCLQLFVLDYEKHDDVGLAPTFYNNWLLMFYSPTHQFTKTDASLGRTHCTFHLLLLFHQSIHYSTLF